MDAASNSFGGVSSIRIEASSLRDCSFTLFSVYEWPITYRFKLEVEKAEHVACVRSTSAMPASSLALMLRFSGLLMYLSVCRASALNFWISSLNASFHKCRVARPLNRWWLSLPSYCGSLKVDSSLASSHLRYLFTKSTVPSKEYSSCNGSDIISFDTEDNRSNEHLIGNQTNPMPDYLSQVIFCQNELLKCVNAVLPYHQMLVPRINDFAQDFM